RCALMSRGSRLNSNSSCSAFSAFSSSSATARSGSVMVATETRSPKFCFMNSVILAFSSSGDGNGGGGGFCCAMCRKTSRQRSSLATVRLKSDAQARDSFILGLFPALILAHTRALIYFETLKNSTPIEFVVSENDAKLRLDQFLAKRLPQYSRSRLQQLIRGGFVRLNEQTIRPRHIVRGGDKIDLIEPPPEKIEPRPEPIPLDVLFEDDDLVV